MTQTPIGDATTVVYADELSERGIQRGVEAGHTYVKLFGNDGPDIRFEARPPEPGRPVAIMGDTVDAPSADLEARVSNAAGGPYVLQLVKDGQVARTDPVAGPQATVNIPAQGPGRYRLQLMRGSAVEAVTTPIWIGPREPLRVRGIWGPRSKVRAGRVNAGCRATGTDVRECRVRVLSGGRELGRASAPVTAGRAMLKVPVGRVARLASVTLEVSALDREGRAATVTRRTRLL